MKAGRAEIEKALSTAAGGVRFFLLYGPDEEGSRALGRLVAGALGSGCERVDLSGVDLRADPARLADEAASISLFGGARYVWVEPAGDEIVEAVQALIDAPAAGNPVVLIAGALKAGSKLLKVSQAVPSALAFASYPPEGRDADRLAIEIARSHGLGLGNALARRIADAAGGNRAIMAQELAKLALFADASPERPQAIDEDAFEAVGATNEEGDLSRLVDAVSGGDAVAVRSELMRLASEGVEGISLIRAVLRRMMLLARLRAEVERGSSVDAVMASQGKSLFWKEKPVVAQQVGRWRSELAAKAVGRLLNAEREMKASGGLGPVAVDEELFAICRQAARLR